jgi:RecJ-like exonuclease
MLQKLKSAIVQINSLSKQKPIKVISHYDTDGITSAAIFSRALQRWKKKFSLQIVKGLEESTIDSLPEDHVLIFLDLASGNLSQLKKKKASVFILDHHEVIQKVPENVTLLNPHLENAEIVSSAALCYLFAKSLSHENRDLASLAIVGMVGDVLERNIGKIYDEIIKDSETIVKKGLLLYPSTRPLDKTLEYSSNPYIPGISGSYKNSLELIKEANIPRENGRFKALYELTKEEMSSLTTAIMLKCIKQKNFTDMIGNIYLIKFFNKLEDARELSALINACSRMDRPEVSLGFCLGNKKYHEEADKIYIEYKQQLISALRFVSESEKIIGKNYTIINARDQVKDTIIGTVASIISRSPIYEEGTIIVTLAYNQDKIKVSARIAGREGLNVREVLNKVIVQIGGEVGGHSNAAGCLIPRAQEELFIQELKKVLDIETIKA